MRPLPPAAGKWPLVGEMLKVHGRASCATLTRWPLTVTLPVRAIAVGFDATVAVIVACPWPDVVARWSQSASLAAVHVQSRVVFTVTDTRPPSGPTRDGCALNVVPQRMSSGAATSVTLVAPHAATMSAVVKATSASRACRYS